MRTDTKALLALFNRARANESELASVKSRLTIKTKKMSSNGGVERANGLLVEGYLLNNGSKKKDTCQHLRLSFSEISR